MAWTSKDRINGVYVAFWKDEDGKQRQERGFADKKQTKILAQDREDEANLIRKGMKGRDERTHRKAEERSIGDHCGDYHDQLIAKARKRGHARTVYLTLGRLLREAAIVSIADIAPDRIQSALARWKAKGRSARTCNHGIACVRAFAQFLYDSNRIAVYPRGLKTLTTYNEEADRRRVRRSLTRDELERLYAASPPEREIVYRVAAGTGFRLAEIKSLMRANICGTTDTPHIILGAYHTKNGRDCVQPISRDLANRLLEYLKDFTPGKPVFPIAQRMPVRLRTDLEAAKIPLRTDAGIIDFHALRTTYISLLIADGNDPKTVQSLARHSTITLTVDRYAKTSDEARRKAVEGNP